MIQLGFILALAFGFADLGRAEVPSRATPPIALAALDNAAKPETTVGAPGAANQVGDPKGPAGLTPELRPAAPVDRRSQERAPSGNPLWAVPLSLLSVTRDRPIFSPSRRPPPAAVAAAAVVEPPPRRHRVRRVRFTRNSRSSAPSPATRRASEFSSTGRRTTWSD